MLQEQVKSNSSLLASCSPNICHCRTILSSFGLWQTSARARWGTWELKCLRCREGPQVHQEAQALLWHCCLIKMAAFQADCLRDCQAWTSRLWWWFSGTQKCPWWLLFKQTFCFYMFQRWLLFKPLLLSMLCIFSKDGCFRSRLCWWCPGMDKQAVLVIFKHGFSKDSCFTSRLCWWVSSSEKKKDNSSNGSTEVVENADC